MRSLIIPGIVGRIALEPGKPVEPGLEMALGSLAPAGLHDQLSVPGIGIGAVQGHVARDGELCCAVSGNIDWLDYKLADTQLKRGPAAALFQAYRQHGQQCLAVCGGRFAIAIWDESRRAGLVACDRFCQMPLYWAQTSEGDLVFGPTATAVRHLLGTTPRLSDQGVFNYLYFHMVPGPATVFDGIAKLMAAHALVRAPCGNRDN